MGAAEFYKKLLTDGKRSEKCGVCEQKLGPGKEMETFEQAVSRLTCFIFYAPF